MSEIIFPPCFKSDIFDSNLFIAAFSNGTLLGDPVIRSIVCKRRLDVRNRFLPAIFIELPKNVPWD
jgi:hypothetical protein